MLPQAVAVYRIFFFIPHLGFSLARGPKAHETRGLGCGSSEICGFQCGPRLSVGPVTDSMARGCQWDCGCCLSCSSQWDLWLSMAPMAIGLACGCQWDLWLSGTSVAIGLWLGCQWHWLLGWHAVSGTCGGPCDAGYHSCWWRLWLSVGLEVTYQVWPKAGTQTWPMPRLAPPACCPCFLLPRTLQRSPTVLSEVPFPTARFPSRDGGSIEACDKCLHTDPFPAVSVCRGHQAAAHLPAPATLLVKVHFCKYVHIK